MFHVKRPRPGGRDANPRTADPRVWQQVAAPKSAQKGDAEGLVACPSVSRETSAGVLLLGSLP
jgi:hypothetical protein